MHNNTTINKNITILQPKTLEKKITRTSKTYNNNITLDNTTNQPQPKNAG